MHDQHIAVPGTRAPAAPDPSAAHGGHITGNPAEAGERKPPGPRLAAGPTTDRPAHWLTAAMLSLAALAGASAVVSYAAQYRMVLAAKGSAPAAALEAAIPDMAALIFAT